MFTYKLVLTRILDACIMLVLGSTRLFKIFQILASFSWSRIKKFCSVFAGSENARDITLNPNRIFFCISGESALCIEHKNKQKNPTESQGKESLQLVFSNLLLEWQIFLHFLLYPNNQEEKKDQSTIPKRKGRDDKDHAKVLGATKKIIKYTPLSLLQYFLKSFCLRTFKPGKDFYPMLNFISNREITWKQWTA